MATGGMSGGAIWKKLQLSVRSLGSSNTGIDGDGYGDNDENGAPGELNLSFRNLLHTFGSSNTEKTAGYF